MAKRNYSLICKCIFLLSSLVMLPACSKEFSAESITGWVVDADTGEPLEGVNITANWEVKEGTIMGTNTGGQINVMETVTDETGRFYFPAWGPKPLPAKRTGKYVDQYLGSADPKLVFFKSGYGFMSLRNEMTPSRNTATVRRSQWNGKTIKMERFKGSKEAYIKHMSSARSFLGFVLSGTLAPECDWKKIPRMLGAVLMESERARRPEIYDGLLLIQNIPTDPECGSPQDILKEYLK